MYQYLASTAKLKVSSCEENTDTIFSDTKLCKANN